jgi:hypothetical protein
VFSIGDLDWPRGRITLLRQFRDVNSDSSTSSHVESNLSLDKRICILNGYGLLLPAPAYLHAANSTPDDLMPVLLPLSNAYNETSFMALQRTHGGGDGSRSSADPAAQGALSPTIASDDTSDGTNSKNTKPAPQIMPGDECEAAEGGGLVIVAMTVNMYISHSSIGVAPRKNRRVKYEFLIIPTTREMIEYDDKEPWQHVPFKKDRFKFSKQATSKGDRQQR